MCAMKQFCRTCGKSIVPQHCLQIFSREGRQLLLCLRAITNCWLRNSPDFPSHMCTDCQTLLKQVQSFRRRCSRIEKFLAKRRSKCHLTDDPASVPLQLPVQQPAAPDPLGIDELLTPNDIKQEAEPASLQQPEKREEAEEDEGNFEQDLLPLQEDYGEPLPKEVSSFISQPDQCKVKARSKCSKQTMRLGRKLIHVKVIDDKQPKRIVDRNGQAAKPCICEHCGRQFKDTSNLNVHLLRHTGTKPFECDQCHQKCYTLHLLRRHQLKHTEGPYTCTFCGLEYSTNSSRVRHEREACKKGRAPQSKWEIIKKGERTFHCEVCDLWFLRAGNFTQHINSSSHIENERRKARKSKSVQSTEIKT